MEVKLQGNLDSTLDATTLAWLDTHMTSSTTFTATHNGITDTRTSKTATYTHVVWCESTTCADDDETTIGAWQWSKSEANALKALATHQRTFGNGRRFIVLPVD